MLNILEQLVIIAFGIRKALAQLLDRLIQCQMKYLPRLFVFESDDLNVTCLSRRCLCGILKARAINLTWF